MENYISRFNIEVDWAMGKSFHCTGSHGVSGCAKNKAYRILGNGFLCEMCIAMNPFRILNPYPGSSLTYATDSITSYTTTSGEAMCDKSEVKTNWSVRIDSDGHKRYTARFAKRDYESRDGYNHLDSNVEKSFDTFDEALKWVNETYKSFK